MSIFEMEKMLEQAEIADKIASGTVDDQAYNVLTKTVNESVLTEGAEEVEKILENGKVIKGEVNLESLETDINETLGAINEGEDMPKETTEKEAKVEATEAPEVKATEEAKVESTETSKEKAKVEATEAPKAEETPKAEEAKVESTETPSEEAKVEATEETATEEAATVMEAGECEEGCKCACHKKTLEESGDPSKPAKGIDNVEKFQNAAPTSAKEFVDANTNKEHEPSGAADKSEVDKVAEKGQKEMVKGAEDKKKFEENSKSQNEVDVTKKPKTAMEAAAKYKAFVESIKNDENAKYVDAVLKGFDVIFPEE